DGKPRYYGAKTICAGGYYTVPRLYTAGGLIVGESASLVNMARLKGIHLAIKSGMLAAATIFEALRKGDYGEETLSGYRRKVESSTIWKELHGARNFHQALGTGGVQSFVHLGLQFFTGGRGVIDPMEIRSDNTRTETVLQYYGRSVEPEELLREKDGAYLLDKLTDVFNAGVTHEENQPSHLQVLNSDQCWTCWQEYRSPCTHFCPANVYEMLPVASLSPGGREDQGEGSVKGKPTRQLRVNFANCVHCKSCDIKCPPLNIRWMPPEGGGGPKYTVQ
ncbi:MAG: 4Fe-4S dicluster domain-containing protein, partial [Nitrospirae bacterium]|nr:4Fe-4S dicluster domain-containing protein [Nitrospirota bacterium]